KFMLEIAEYLIPTKHLHEIDDIDEVFSEHCQERRQVYHEPGPTNPRDPVTATDRDHHPAEGGLILFKLAFTGDRDIDVLRDPGGTLLTVFHRLRNRLGRALWSVVDVITGHIQPFVINTPKVFVGIQPSPFRTGHDLTGLLGYMGRFDPGHPDHRAGRLPADPIP